MDFFNKNITWDLADIILIYLLIMGGGLLLSILAPDIITFMYFKGIEPSELNLFLLNYFVQFTLTVLLVFFFVLLVRRSKLEDLGVNKVSLAFLLRYGVGGGIFLIAAVLVLSIPINYLNPDLSPQVYEEILRTVQNNCQFMLMFLAGTVLAPWAEELFYRGMIYPVLRKYLGVKWGIAAAGIIFGLAHMDLWRAVPLSAGGMVLCYIYEKTGSLWPSFIAHGIWNGLMAFALYMQI